MLSDSSLSTRTFWRLADVHTPMTALRLVGSPTAASFCVARDSGSCSTIEWTFTLLSGFTPSEAAIGMMCAFCNGRNTARSKIEPRSTQNASLRCPAKTFSPVFRVLIAVLARAS